MPEEFVDRDLAGALFQNVNFAGARFREAFMAGARISGMIDGLVVNDVEVGPLISAELDRRYPDRSKLRPRDITGVREAWSTIEGIWGRTKARVASVPEPTLHERVDGEWSFLETCRHLAFVTDTWVSGRVLGETDQFHPLGVAPSFIPDPASMGIDVDADPDLATVVAVREERMAVVANLIADLDEEDLARPCGDETVLHCLCVVFDEEWHHDWYANRDLDTLTRGT